MKDENGHRRQYRPWGQVRRRNLFARMRHLLFMTFLGLASMALISLIAVFAASVVVIGMIGCAGIALLTYLFKGFVRAPAKTRAEGDAKAQAKGVFTARKVGNTWVSY
jgi:threonine/homoserine/homoserine lactone efflux protein